MSATVTVPTTVEELAAGIAADIRRYGHHQGGDDTPSTRRGDPGTCCVAFNPTVGVMKTSDAVRLAEAIGLSSELPFRGLIEWNDDTPTADVLAVLDRIAAGLNWREQGLNPAHHDRCPECQVGLIVHVGLPEHDTGHQNVACTECGFTS